VVIKQKKKKKICEPIKAPIKKWSAIRKGLCRKKFVCGLNDKTKKHHCKFTGKVYCKKVRKLVKPKLFCLFKEDKTSKKGFICRSRYCCTGAKCKKVAKSFCAKVKSFKKDFCNMSIVGKGRCKRKYCCKSGKCGFVGKKICKILADKKLKVQIKEKCLFKHEVAKNSDQVCSRRLCCFRGRCLFKTQKVCRKITAPFCVKTFARSGKCVSTFCCKINKNKKKYNCKSRGRRTCFKLPAKKTIKCRWNYKTFNGQVCSRRICCNGKKM